MNNPHPPSAHQSSDVPPVQVSQTFPQPPRRSCAPIFLLGCGGLFLLMLVCVVGAGILLYRSGYVAQTDPNRDEFLRIEKNKFAHTADAYSNPEIEFSRNEATQISAKIQQVLRYARVDNRDRVRSLIDVDGFIRQMERSGETGSVGFLDRMVIRSSFDQVTEGPWEYAHVKIVSLKRIGDDEAIAYLYLWDDMEDIHEHRWWLIKRNGEWRLTDWEYLRRGMSEATEYAILFEQQQHPGVQEYYKFITAVERIASFIESGNQEAARGQLRIAEGFRIHPKFHDWSRLLLAYQWRQLGDFDHVQQLLSTIRRPETIPGVSYVHAWAAVEEDPSLVLEMVDLITRALGNPPEVLYLRARALQAQGNHSQAVEHWTKLLEVFPNHQEAFQEVASQLAEGNQEELHRLVLAAEHPDEILMMLADRVYDPARLKLLDALAQIANQVPNGAAIAQYIDGLRQRQLYDYPTAAQCFLEAAGVATTKEQQSKCWTKYLQTMANMSRWVEAYQSAPPTDQTFQTLCDEMNLVEPLEDPDAMLRLIDLHRETNPSYAWLDYYQAIALEHKGAYEEAVQAFQAGLQALRGQPESESVEAAIRHRIVNLRAALQQVIPAYQSSRDKPSTFILLASRLEEFHRWKPLEELIAAHQQIHPDDPWVPYYLAILKQAQGQLSEAFEILDQVRFVDATAMDSPPVKRLQVELALQNKSWDSLFADSRDKSAIFTLLADAMLQKKQPGSLRRLLQLHHERALPLLERIPYELHLAKQERNPSAAATALDQLTESDWQSVDPWTQRDWKLDQLDGYLAMNRIKDAEKLSQSLGSDLEEPLGPLMFHIRQGNVNQCDRYLEDIAQWPFLLTQIYEQDRFEPFRSQVMFDRLRTKYPRMLPNLAVSETAHCLYQQPPTVDLESIVKMLTDETGQTFEATRYPSRSPDSKVVTAVIGSQRSRWLVEFYEPAYDGRDIWSARAIQDQLQQHKHAIAISPITSGDGESHDALLKRIARWMASTGCSAIYFDQSGRLLNSPVQQLAEQAAEPSTAIHQLGMNCIMSVSAARLGDPSDPEELLYWQQQRELKKVAAAFSQKQEGEEIQIQVAVIGGATTERVWLNLISKFGQEMNNSHWIATVAEISPLLPQFQVGDRVLVSGNRVLNWKRQMPTTHD